MSNAAIIAACAAANASIAAANASSAAARRPLTFTEAADQLGTGRARSFKPRRKTKRQKVANKRRVLAARLRQEV